MAKIPNVRKSKPTASKGNAEWASVALQPIPELGPGLMDAFHIPLVTNGHNQGMMMPILALPIQSTPVAKSKWGTVWTEKDTMDLIDAVRTVEFNQILACSQKRAVTSCTRNKWEEVVKLLPDCQMSGSKNFLSKCKGRFQELRRRYQAMLDYDTAGRKGMKFFMSENVCQKMRDYADELPPDYLFEELENRLTAPLMMEDGCVTPRGNKKEGTGGLKDLTAPLMIEDGCVTPRGNMKEGTDGPKGMTAPLMVEDGCVTPSGNVKDGMGRMEDPKAAEKSSTKVVKSSCRSQSSEEQQQQRPRRSSRVCKRTYICDSSSESDESLDSLPKRVSCMSAPANPAAGVPAGENIEKLNVRTKTLPKRIKTGSDTESQGTKARLEEENRQFLRSESVDYVRELFTTGFGVLEDKLEFSIKYHVREHFKKIEDHITDLIGKMEEKFESFHQKLKDVDQKLDENTGVFR